MRKLILAAACVAGCATPPAPVAEPRADATSASIPMQVIKPDGAGPFPAVVVMHDCSGLGPRSSGSPARWAALLVKQGYVVLMPDSFATRGFPAGVCTDPSPQRTQVAPSRRVRDAYEALAQARALPYVDGNRVGIMGGSHGGSTTLATLAARRPSERPGFAAAVALYPGCGARYGEWTAAGEGVYRNSAPLLILVGEMDDWTPAEPCRRLAQRSQAAGMPLDLKVYPGAHHAFDSDRPVRFVAERVNGNAAGGRGATTGGNAAAWEDSKREVAAFFARHLAGGAKLEPPR